MMFRRLLAATLLLLSTLAACESTKHTPSEPPIARGQVPPYATVATAYNARVARLERLAAAGDVRVHYKDDKGKPLSDQVESNVQLALPASVAVRLDKVGQAIFYLGSNDTRYWWFDLTDEKTALVGSHDKATPESVAAFGLPVHPLDLLEIFAIKPIPAAESEQAAHAALAWSKDGRLLGLTLPGRWQGSRRFWLDPKTYDPLHVELLDNSGRVGASAVLSRYEQVEVIGDARVHPRMATDFQIDLPTQQAKVALRLSGLKNPGEAQKPKLFDLDFLLKYYKIQKTIDIDQHQPGRRAALDGSSK
jgi:hypothetical protein